MSKRSASSASVLAQYRKRGRFGDLFHRIMKNKGAIVGLIILCIMVLTFFYSLTISWDSITAASVPDILAAPSWRLPFGADDMGRNLFLRVVYGSRYSLAIGFGAVLIGLILGLFLGCISGYFGGKIDVFIMRVCDVMSSIPGILFPMVIMTALGQSLLNLILAMGITSIPLYARISRASMLSVRGEEFIEAARSIGFSNFRVIFTEVLPNGMAPIIITVTTSLGMTILGAAGLSFIGYGVRPPAPEWGGLVSSGRSLIRSAPWVSLFPGIIIMITVLAFSMLGDGLRDALDPKLKGRR